jgi:hypothetical protein
VDFLEVEEEEYIVIVNKAILNYKVESGIGMGIRRIMGRKWETSKDVKN